MDYFSLLILVLAAIFLWWVVKERGRNERERQVSVELANRLFRLEEQILKLEVELERRTSRDQAIPNSFSTGTREETIPSELSRLQSVNEIVAETDPALPGAVKHSTISLSDPPSALDAAINLELASTNSSPQPGQESIPSSANGPATLSKVKNGSRPFISRPLPPKNGQVESPKLGEIGMAALLCGIAMLSKNEQGPQKQGRE